MKDVTLYEYEPGKFWTKQTGAGASVPAVVGITVAEVEGRVAVCECEWEGGEGCERLLKAERERDEARAEAARYREALEGVDALLTGRVSVGGKHELDRLRLIVMEAAAYTGEALGGGDG